MNGTFNENSFRTQHTQFCYSNQINEWNYTKCSSHGTADGTRQTPATPGWFPYTVMICFNDSMRCYPTLAALLPDFILCVTCNTGRRLMRWPRMSKLICSTKTLPNSITWAAVWRANKQQRIDSLAWLGKKISRHYVDACCFCLQILDGNIIWKMVSSFLANSNAGKS